MCRRDDGFTLIEVLVAMTLLATAAAGVASLIVTAAASVRSARAHTWAGLLASDKMEALRGLQWPALASSPGGSLQRNAAGFVDYLDASGRELSTGAAGHAVYVRRWSVLPLPVASADALVLQVLVIPGALRDVEAARPSALPGGVLLTSIRTRKDL